MSRSADGDPHNGETLSISTQGTTLKVGWLPPSEGRDSRPETGADVGLHLAQLWARVWNGWEGKWTVLDGEAGRIFSGFTRERGWQPLERVTAELTRPDGRRLPLRVLEPLAQLPAWTYGDRTVWAVPRGPEIGYSVEELRRLESAYEATRRAGAMLMGLADYRFETEQGGMPRWMVDAADHLEAARDLFAERVGLLKDLLRGSDPARIKGTFLDMAEAQPAGDHVEHSQPNPQAWTRLRQVAAELALEIHAAMRPPRRRLATDDRLRHGAFRVDPARRTIKIIHALYNVTFDLRDLKVAVQTLQRREAKLRGKDRDM
jgi:hypothetical protein